MSDKQKTSTRPVSTQDYLQISKNISLFEGLEPEVQGDILKRASMKHFPRAAVLMGPHKEITGIYILLYGRAKSVYYGENGREFILAPLKPGDFLGENILFECKPSEDTVIAAEPCVFLFWERETFMSLLRIYPHLAMRLFQKTSERLRRANEFLCNVALYDVPDRLLRLLRVLAEENGKDYEDGILISERPTQQELANMMGTCRETVSRLLASMTRKGLLEQRGRALYLSGTFLNQLKKAA